MINPTQYPRAVQTYQLAGKEISSTAPIEEKFPIKMWILRSVSGEEAEIKMICKFSYGKNESYSDEQKYNRRRHECEHSN